MLQAANVMGVKCARLNTSNFMCKSPSDSGMTLTLSSKPADATRRILTPLSSHLVDPEIHISALPPVTFGHQFRRHHVFASLCSG